MDNDTTLYYLTEKESHPKKENSDSETEKDLLQDQKHFTISLFDALREGCLILDKNLRVKSVNEQFLNMFQVEEGKLKNKLLYELGNGQWNIPELKKLLEDILPERKKVKDFKVTHQFEDVGTRVMMLNASMIDHLQLILITIEDISERTKYLDDLNKSHLQLESIVKERTNQVRELAMRLTKSEQREREKFSSLLHDDLQQILVALQMNLKSQRKKSESEDLSERLKNDFEQNLFLIEKAISTTRELTSDLNPSILETENLGEILDWLKSKFEKLYDFKIDVEINKKVALTNKNFRSDLVQVLRESLFNVVKHAEVNKAKVMVEAGDNSIIINITDSGKGFNPDQKKMSYGLATIKDRVNLHTGNIHIESTPEKGTNLTFEFPLHVGIRLAP